MLIIYYAYINPKAYLIILKLKSHTQITTGSCLWFFELEAVSYKCLLKCPFKIIYESGVYFPGWNLIILWEIRFYQEMCL